MGVINPGDAGVSAIAVRLQLIMLVSHVIVIVIVVGATVALSIYGKISGDATIGVLSAAIGFSGGGAAARGASIAASNRSIGRPDA